MFAGRQARRAAIPARRGAQSSPCARRTCNGMQPCEHHSDRGGCRHCRCDWPARLAAHEVEEGKGQLGKVSFANSCDPKVQAEFERAVAMLHSFWYSAGEKAFRDVLEDDPGCAHRDLGHRGDPDVESAGRAGRIAEGRRAGAGGDRRRAAASAPRPSASATTSRPSPPTTQDFANRPERERQARARAGLRGAGRKLPRRRRGADLLRALHRRARRRRPTRPTPRTSRPPPSSRSSSRSIPTIPGVAHYLIHSYDAPPIADKGLAAARRYAGIAPAAPHALHMPSHIFTRVGAWQESAATNRRSARSGQGEATSRTRPITPPTTWCTRTCSSRATPRRAASIDER